MFRITDDVVKLMSRSSEGIFPFRQLLADITPVHYLDGLVRDITELLKEKDYTGHGLIITIDKLIYNGYGNILVFSKKGFFIGSVPYYIYSPDNNQEIMVSVNEMVRRKSKSIVELQAILLEPFYRCFLKNANKTKLLTLLEMLSESSTFGNLSKPANEEGMVKSINLSYVSNSVRFDAVDANGNLVFTYNLHIF